jgi:N-acetyl-anhydromuramyl-L-alanine amidase AmpD
MRRCVAFIPAILPDVASAFQQAPLKGWCLGLFAVRVILYPTSAPKIEPQDDDNMPKHAFKTLAILIPLSACGCLGPAAQFGRPGQQLARGGDEIVVCGQLFHTGAPVVLWTDPGGYDAYRMECRFDPEKKLPTRAGKNPSPTRYSTFRGSLPAEVLADVQSNGWKLEELQKHVDMFVMHYDVCGTSRQCFKVLHDLRGLSVHFMLDVDGTIYQTLDLKERGAHATIANDRSIGIEIANIGAYPKDELKTLNEWYTKDPSGRTYNTLPAWMKKTGVRTAGYVAHPARNEMVEGNIQGEDLCQYDLTDAQYDSLIKLTATLCKVLPRIKPDYPRDAAGKLRPEKLTEEEYKNFSGLVGHYHIQKNKTDPGPAFDWDRLVTGVKREMR